MKVCPVCTESFGDEFSFCDIDGTKLKRDSSSPPAQNKVWSLLGVGLLIGAVVISAAAIIFLRKAPVSPVVARSNDSQTNSAPARPANEETRSSAAAVEQEDVNADLPSVVARKQEKAQDLTNANVSDGSGANVKSAVQPAKPGDGPPQSETTVLAPPPPKPETPIIETRAPEPQPKSVESSAEKKESKSTAKNGKDSDDKKKKDDDKEKKKGGGFLKVFKKIFGKG